MPRQRLSLGPLVLGLATLATGARGAESLIYRVLGPYSTCRAPRASPPVTPYAERTCLDALAQAGPGAVAAAAHLGGSADARSFVIRVDPARDSAGDIALPQPPPHRVTALAAPPTGLYAGSSSGVLRIEGRSAQPVDQFAGVHEGSIVLPTAWVRELAVALVADADGSLWAAGDPTAGGPFEGYGGFIMFATDPARWVTEYAGTHFDKPYPHLLRWRAPFAAMAGDPTKAGVWVYGRRTIGSVDLVHVDPSMASPFPTADPPSAVPAGKPVPFVAGGLLAAGPDGAVWLAGDTLDGAKLYVFRGQEFADVTPPAQVLKARRFTALLAGPKGELYAATDGVGVLVFDGKAWRPHPVTSVLPTLEGTALRPTTCLTLDSTGALWVGCDNNLICWREGTAK